jgi:hypothetical protein
MQRDSETGSAAGVVVGRRACRFTTSHRSAKAANVMASTISSRRFTFHGTLNGAPVDLTASSKAIEMT